MPQVENTVEITAPNEVLIMVQTSEVIDAIGPENVTVTDDINDALEAMCESEGVNNWWHVPSWHDTEPIRTALATAIGIDREKLETTEKFNTLNFENLLTNDFAANIYRDTANGQDYMVIIGGDNGSLDSVVSVRDVQLKEMPYVIGRDFSEFTVECLTCEHYENSDFTDIDWTDWVEVSDGDPTGRLTCPRCNSLAGIDTRIGD